MIEILITIKFGLSENSGLELEINTCLLSCKDTQERGGTSINKPGEKRK